MLFIRYMSPMVILMVITASLLYQRSQHWFSSRKRYESYGGHVVNKMPVVTSAYDMKDGLRSQKEDMPNGEYYRMNFKQEKDKQAKLREFENNFKSVGKGHQRNLRR